MQYLSSKEVPFWARCAGYLGHKSAIVQKLRDRLIEIEEEDKMTE